MKNENLKDVSGSFVPSYSVSLLYQNESKLALRVFISDAKSEKEAKESAIWTYSWSMQNYQLVQAVVVKIGQPG